MDVKNEEYWGMPLNTYCMLLHLSQLSSIIIPGLGFIMPIVMWLTNKDKNSRIDEHGKATVNWLISLIIYYAVSSLLVFIVIGIFGLVILAILNIIFAIVAAVKANQGEVWTYPLSIQFFK